MLFPAPEGATMATISPRFKCRFASLKTINSSCGPWKIFRSERASRTNAPKLPAPSGDASAVELLSFAINFFS